MKTTEQQIAALERHIVQATELQKKYPKNGFIRRDIAATKGLIQDLKKKLNQPTQC